MSYQDQVYRYLEQAERQMEENERRFGEFRRIQPQLAELVGEGYGAEGKVKVTWTQTGLQDIDFDPRALRLTSDILSREVKAAIRAAMEHLQAQTMELIEGVGVTVPQMPDAEEAQAQMARFREEMIGAFKVSAQELDRVAELRRQYDAARSRPTRD